MAEFLEQTTNDVMIDLKKPENIKRRVEQALDADRVEAKICIECGWAYGIPHGSPYGMEKFGTDDGRCWECKGAYDDPDGFISF